MGIPRDIARMLGIGRSPAHPRTGGYAAAGRLAYRAAGLGWRHRGGVGLMAAGSLAFTAGAGTAGLAAYRFQQSIVRANEAEDLSQMILRAQSGPFGPSAKAMGFGANTNNTAGLTLAAHYARNRNKSFGVLGMRFL